MILLALLALLMGMAVGAVILWMFGDGETCRDICPVCAHELEFDIDWGEIPILVCWHCGQHCEIVDIDKGGE